MHANVLLNIKQMLQKKVNAGMGGSSTSVRIKIKARE